MILPMAPGWKTGNLGKNRCHTYWAKIESILDSGQGMLQPALSQCCKTKIAISFHTLSSLWRSLMHVLFDMKRKAASGQKTAFYAKKKEKKNAPSKFLKDEGNDVACYKTQVTRTSRPRIDGVCMYIWEIWHVSPFKNKMHFNVYLNWMSSESVVILSWQSSAITDILK